MANPEITIFYSWQSDLPASDTRSLIQDSIKYAVKLLRDTVDVEADRDTKGEYGTPDIAQTIFEKIEKCDIFVADVTPVCHYEATEEDGTVKVKYMPNPNVMLELGYATHVLGWENTICILNSDYCAPKDMTFDSSKRRLTSYSIKDGKTKGEVKRYLGNILIDTVGHILETGRRAKPGFSCFRVGSFNGNSVEEKIVPYSIFSSENYMRRRNGVIKECNDLFDAINEYHLEPRNKTEVVEKQEPTEDNSETLPYKLNLFSSYNVAISESDRTGIIELSKHHLGRTICDPDTFFETGSLTAKKDPASFFETEYSGSDEEKNKYNKIRDLESLLLDLFLWEEFSNSFNDLVFLPLAIENTSSISDEDIDVFLTVASEDAVIIGSSVFPLSSQIEGLEGELVEEDVIKTLLMMPESAGIQYDKDISYCLEETQAEIRSRFSGAGINGNPRYDVDDYLRELSKYIICPSEEAPSEVSFHIDSLRAKERKWLGPSLLLRPLSEKIHISFSVRSKRSDGAISGVLEN